MALSFNDFFATNRATVDSWLTSIQGQSTATDDAFNVIVNAETFFLNAAPVAANETDNNQVVVNLNTNNVAAGTVLNFSLTGQTGTVNAADFTSAMTGTLTVGADGTATTTVTIAADALTEGTETFVVGLDNGRATSPVISIADTSTGGVIPGERTNVLLDGQGDAVTAADLSGAADAFNFTDSAFVANNVRIADFGADDLITVTNATAADYDTAISSNAAGDVTLEFNSDGVGNTIVLTGVAVGTFAFDVATFNALAVGDLAFA